MMTPLAPWANGPFELLVHAEEHLRAGDDFDRRIALIGFDNAIEIAIAAYLSLKPIQRRNRSYPMEDVNKWMANYHTKLEFLAFEISARDSTWEVDRTHILWCHDSRNEQYHGGYRGVPEKRDLDIARRAALWIFSFLFDVEDAEERLTRAIAEKLPSPPPERNLAYDTAIDGAYETIDIGGHSYSTSEILYSLDYEAYRELGIELSQAERDAGALQ
jgi:hypothetical protein